jgi:predicted O-methyltransferase YrrM
MYVDPGIEGWMSTTELEWLFTNAKKMRQVVEIGSWKGKSTHALLSGCPGPVYSVDTWLGSPNERAGAHHEATEKDLHALVFLPNVGHFENLRVMKMESMEAVKQFSSKSVDMVFIDGSHDYANVIADINGWLPKTRLLICGHDSGQDGVPQAITEVFGSPKVVDRIWYVWL